MQTKKSKKTYSLWQTIFAITLFLWLATPTLGLAVSRDTKEFSINKTWEIYKTFANLNKDEQDAGLEVIKTMSYDQQRIFRTLCVKGGLDYNSSKQAWSEIFKNNFSYSHVLLFEKWANLSEITSAQAIQGITPITSLSYPAAQTFADWLDLDGVTPESALQMATIFNQNDNYYNQAFQAVLQVQGMDRTTAEKAIREISRFKKEQVAIIKPFTKLADMNREIFMDSLPFFKQTDPITAWNMEGMFRLQKINARESWQWITGYLALQPQIQEERFYQLKDRHKSILLEGLREGSLNLAYKINNLHAITDEEGREISRNDLKYFRGKELQKIFLKLSPETQRKYSKPFYNAIYKKHYPEAIIHLRDATAAERKHVAAILPTANVYSLMSRGGELYDSSFRDILVPELQNRVQKKYANNFISFLRETDPENQLVSSFIISLAQKGKLASFFPKNSTTQKQVLDMVVDSALKDQNSILLFSASFVQLVKVLLPEARSYFLWQMINNGTQNDAAKGRMIATILKYYLKNNPSLLNQKDKARITSFLKQRTPIDLRKYQQTPFGQWKDDRELASLSIFHPDDDGFDSFISNLNTLLNAGYRMQLSDQYSFINEGENIDKVAKTTVSMVRKSGSRKNVETLFNGMKNGNFGIVLSKKINGIKINHHMVVYNGPEQQKNIIVQFIKSGDEMIAQRGHSYWRAEQITDPLQAALEENIISRDDFLNKERFLSLGSCGGMKVYTELYELFAGNLDILATIGTGLTFINDSYNRYLFEVVAKNPDKTDWHSVMRKMRFIFKDKRGQDYIQPGSLTSILHKMMHEQ